MSYENSNIQFINCTATSDDTDSTDKALGSGWYEDNGGGIYFDGERYAKELRRARLQDIIQTCKENEDLRLELLQVLGLG